MSRLPIFIAILLAYVGFARLSLSLSNPRYKTGLFAIVNIAAFACFTLFTSFSVWKDETIISLGLTAIVRHLALIAFYVLIVAIGHFIMRAFSKREGWLPWVAFSYPIVLLIVFKYLYFGTDEPPSFLDLPLWAVMATIIGLSYMAFRLSYLVLEVRNGTVETPGLGEYLGFAFFLPTMAVGPINAFSKHQHSFRTYGNEEIPTGRALLRILVGATKYFFLANLANQLTYAGIFLDGKPHAVIDFFIAIVFFYVYLFLNFSGFCDIAIGLAGLLGIRVSENFDNPFLAKNVKDFWNRWHITLSEYTRDVIFTPVTKGLVKKLGVKFTNLSTSVGVLCVFLVIGLWHGVGIFFVIFGLIHAIGVIANHYYTVWLKRVLGKERYRIYNQNPFVNAAAIALTFAYVACSFIFFANSDDMLRLIRDALIAGL